MDSEEDYTFTGKDNEEEKKALPEPEVIIARTYQEAQEESGKYKTAPHVENPQPIFPSESDDNITPQQRRKTRKKFVCGIIAFLIVLGMMIALGHDPHAQPIATEPIETETVQPAAIAETPEETAETPATPAATGQTQEETGGVKRIFNFGLSKTEPAPVITPIPAEETAPVLDGDEWHLSLGGFTTLALDDVTHTGISTLAVFGPDEWQLIAGLGWQIESGVTLTVGFAYRVF